ncbi:MAG TPA: serine/threonine protein kinase, partial [Phycisphaerae bacterium]|nr:serine/threonine protein kinase [Phycisphaerae bacterium]
MNQIPNNQAAGEGNKALSFAYQYGDKPLDGYTIQRALGRGGFGEVYYALSDSGRQVALKVVQGYEQIELRGVQQCMNLKNPHLVTIFDVKYNQTAKPFVIMEYVAGPSLRELLTNSPAGLGTQKSAYFLREIVKGLTFLHDCGIVHRDLKPGNIFYEDGYVKIGDYGLSKAMSAGIASGQTITVGTVHYMAPEIGDGRYDRSIDIYALGIVLYEMLTGNVPFAGDSIRQILMKQMSSNPDLAGVAEPFASAIVRAMDKDPAKRFQTAQEMVEAIFGSENIRTSVSVFSPNSLSIVAGRVAGKIAPTIASSGPNGGPPPLNSANMGSSMATPPPITPTQPVQPPPLGANPRVTPMQERHVSDQLTAGQRRLLALLTLCVVSIGTGLLCGKDFNRHDISSSISLALSLMTGAILGAIIAGKTLKLQAESLTIWRLGFGSIASFTSVILLFLAWGALAINFGHIWAPSISSSSLISICIGLFLFNWKKLTTSARYERVRLTPVFFAG